MLRYCFDITMERYLNRQTGLGDVPERRPRGRPLAVKLRRLRPSRYMTLACCSFARQARRVGWE